MVEGIIIINKFMNYNFVMFKQSSEMGDHTMQTLTRQRITSIKDLIPTGVNRFLEKTITKSQRCQRNWDLSKSIPIEDIKTMKTSITNCSSKQNRVFYKAKFITNRTLIEKIYKETGGPGLYDKNVKTYTESHMNPQTLANLLVVFVRDRDPSESIRTPEEMQHGKFLSAKNEHKNVNVDETTAIGIAAGYLTLVANMLGYSSGCCACGDMSKISELVGETDKTLLLMGVGYPDSTKSRLEHHNIKKRFSSHNKNIIVEDIT